MTLSSDTHPCFVTHPATVESRFALHSCRTDGDHRVAIIETGPWTRAPGAENHLGPAAVAMDHVLGEVLFEQRPAGTWSVTTELSLSRTGLVATAGPLTARSTAVWVDTAGGIASGEVLDAAGRVVFIGSTRTRVVPLGPGRDTLAFPHECAPGMPPLATAAGPVEHLRCSLETGELTARVQVEAERWSNLFGTLHGGVWAALADLATTGLEPVAERGLSTASLHLFRARPAPAGSVAIVTATPCDLRRSSGVVAISGADGEGRPCIQGLATLASQQGE